MMTEGEAYVRRVQHDTQEYLQDLVAQGERMSSLVSSLESERERLNEELVRVRDELARQRMEHDHLRDTLREMENANRRSVERFGALQEQNNNLANLYVASFRLHGTLDRDEVLSTIQEIVANLIGCEEIALFESHGDGATIELIHSVGIDPEPLRRLERSGGIMARVARSGEKFVRTETPEEGVDPAEKHLTACVPLMVGENVIGVLALFRLLPQKRGGYQGIDYELMDLLTTHAATALHCSSQLARISSCM
jgi:transcriptional regulator with GAF, ATPase, and Fis domain